MNIKKINRRIERISRWLNDTKDAHQAALLFDLYRQYKNGALIREMEAYRYLEELVLRGELSTKNGDGLFYSSFVHKRETQDTSIMDAFIAIQAIREDYNE